MTGVLILASFAVGVMALGQAILGAITRQPFSGIHATTFWTLTGVCIVLGALALFFFHNDPTPGAFA